MSPRLEVSRVLGWIGAVCIASSVACGSQQPPPPRERVPDTTATALPPGAVRIAPGRSATASAGPSASITVLADTLPPGAVVAIEPVIGDEPAVDQPWRRVTAVYRVWPGIIPRPAVGHGMHSVRLPLAVAASMLGRSVDLRRAQVYARNRDGIFQRIDSVNPAVEGETITVEWPALDLDEGASEQIVFVAAPEGVTEVANCGDADRVLRDRLSALQQCAPSDRCEERTYPLGGEPCLFPAVVGRDGTDVQGSIEGMRRSGCPLPNMQTLTGDAQALHLCERAPQSTGTSCLGSRCVYVVPQ